MFLFFAVAAGELDPELASTQCFDAINRFANTNKKCIYSFLEHIGGVSSDSFYVPTSQVTQGARAICEESCTPVLENMLRNVSEVCTAAIYPKEYFSKEANPEDFVTNMKPLFKAACLKDKNQYCFNKVIYSKKASFSPIRFINQFVDFIDTGKTCSECEATIFSNAEQFCSKLVEKMIPGTQPHTFLQRKIKKVNEMMSTRCSKFKVASSSSRLRFFQLIKIY